MSGPDWLKDLYVGAKQFVKAKYNKDKETAKDILEFFGFDSNSSVYKSCAHASNVAEPIFSGVVETMEFVAKNPKETYGVMSDLCGWAIEGDEMDTKRLLNYLYAYSQETEGDMKTLLNEIPPQSLSKVLKQINHKLSVQQNIPCSEVCMDIALSDPSNIHENNYWTTDEKQLEEIISNCNGRIPKKYIPQLNTDLPIIEFSENSPHSQMLSNNDLMQIAFSEWMQVPEEKRVHGFGIVLNERSDKTQGRDVYASFHKMIVLNPTIDEEGNIHAYAYDIYDFERASFNGEMLDFATIMAHHLQESGHLQNYRILVPFTIPADKLKPQE